jgi:exopolysaccharide biosynthesis polyprenyl glycosylphosphotransferase
MRRRSDTFEVLCSLTAGAADAVAVVIGVLLAMWIRFDSGWIGLIYAPPGNRDFYYYGAGIAAIIFILIFKGLELYRRPQTGAFSEYIPRIVRACGIGIILCLVLAFGIRTDPPFSRLVAAISFFTITLLVIAERFALARIERHYAKHQTRKNDIVIIGINPTAAGIKAAIEREPRLRSRVVAFLKVAEDESDPGIDPALIQGDIDQLAAIIAERAIDQVILTDSNLSREKMIDLILLCEREVVRFRMVPDMLRLLTTKVEMQTIGGIPLLGTSKWPLDIFWNRAAKRIEDIVGASIGLLISAPLIVVAACAIKRSSPGPILYRQTRCGERGRHFTLYKLRTMHADAEKDELPGWSTANDPRRTPVGGFLRKWNIDELPQFWNVLKGDMSLVGPRPERPHFVEKFRADISRYMWRHVSKPGMTGWAQVNGLRGDTSIPDRIAHDLYYLENWSLALDFKILSKTIFARGDDYAVGEL